MKNISPKEAFEMLEKTPNTILVDVRTNDEVLEMAIPKSLHIPLSELPGRLHELPLDATVMFHCRSGGRSAQAVLFAESKGYTNVSNVTGGITAWTASGLPVTRGGNTHGGFARQGTVALIVVVSIIVLFGLMLFFKTGTQGGAPNTPVGVQKTAVLGNITSRDLAMMLDKKDFFFVNVHIPYEGELKNTDAFIPYDKITDNLDKLPKDKSAKIVLYCRSGRMSEIAGNELLGLGYTNVSQLSGGMIDWEKNGYAIIKK